MLNKDTTADHWDKRDVHGSNQSAAGEAGAGKNTGRARHFADQFLDYSLLFVFLAFVAVSAWLFVTMPAGSRDPGAPFAGKVPHLAWLLSLFPSVLPDGPLKCGTVYLYSSRAPADPESAVVTVSEAPPHDSTNPQILQLWAFDPGHIQNGRYRSVYEQRSLDRASLRPLTFAEFPVSHVDGHLCWPYKPFACSADSPYC